MLTEDDYFRYLIGVTRNEELLPKVVGSALVNTALLFVGFRLEDWNFRVLFQSVMNLAGAELRRRYTHVAVQLDPHEETMLNPQAAREYLKSYFGATAALNYQISISIYWGSSEDFLMGLPSSGTRPVGRDAPPSRVTPARSIAQRTARTAAASSPPRLMARHGSFLRTTTT